MSGLTRLLLVRHGEPDPESSGRCYGRLDIGLSERGRRDAQRLARALAGVPCAAVYASPARRAVESAAPLAAVHGLTPVIDEAWQELDFGAFEGLRYEEIERAHPTFYRAWMETPTRVEFPGGESYQALRARVLAALDAVRARHAGQTAVVVSHGGPLRAVLAACLAMPAEAVFRIEQGFGAVSVVEWIGPTPRVCLLNGRATDAARRAVAAPPAPPGASGAERGAPEGRARFERPTLPPGFDDSRAASRRGRPDGWRFDEAERAAVMRAISERRDIRRFRSDPLAQGALERLLEAAHRAPSVGLMQPWRFVVVRGEQTKAAMQALAARERLVQAEHFDERSRQYLDLKIEGIREAPLGICVCCDRRAGGVEVLGRHTIPDTDLYSTCLAIENLWLAARAEGIGVGWVSFYRPADLQALLGLPAHVVPVAWLCVGYPDERPLRPGLEAAGWQQRRPLEGFVYEERWPAASPAAPAPAAASGGGEPRSPAPGPPAWWRKLALALVPGDHPAALRVRDRADELVKPAGSLGVLETTLERWAFATGTAAPARPRAGILVCVADHGVALREVSLFPPQVGAQVAAAAARGETAIGVLARALEAELLVVDVGLSGPKLTGLVDRRIASGSADLCLGAALTRRQLRAAVEAGHALACELAGRCDLIVLGEIGIGNTTVASALLAGLSGLSAEEVCGRGTGLDAQGLAHKRRVVEAALAANLPRSNDPLECLRRLGGLEFAALAGAVLGAATCARPVLLDGFATGVAALVACRLEPSLRDYLIAGHRSPEPAHGHVLTELGLEPLLDLRLRLGEASGAALALPLIGLAARLQLEMSRFDEAGVERDRDAAALPGGSRPPAGLPGTYPH